MSIVYLLISMRIVTRHTVVMRESNRNLDIPPPGIPGEFACLVFEEGGNLTFFLVEGGEFAYGVGNLNFSFKHMC